MLLDIFDPKAPPRAIGIDLGTTNSIVACVRDGKPYALVNCDGKELLPSVVYYGTHGEILVGRSAQAYASVAPTRTIASVKRFMGRSLDDPQTRELGAYEFAASGGENRTDGRADNRTVRFEVGKGQVTPLEVSAEILKSLAQSARDQLTHVGGVVITVPAYFDEAQRQATKDAGRLAGLEVLRLLNEPTAAALAYGLEKQMAGTFAVYDLGGGTFDVTILALEDGVFQVKSTGGDSALGGDDMDRIIAKKMLEFIGRDEASVSKEVIALLLESARQLKHDLTEQATARCELPGGQNFEVTRSDFDAWIEPLLERTGVACRRALRDAGAWDAASRDAKSLDGVILVGGSTRVPRVRSYVAQLFGQEPRCDLDPDLVVAFGAALQAEQLAGQRDDVLLLDVLPLSLGVETMGGAVSKILPRNTTIPTGAKSLFTTYADNQTGFELHVVQGERELARDCRSLSRFVLKGIPPMPAGQARLEVEFRVDENSLLHVEARELSSGVRQTVEVHPSYGLDDEQVENMLIDALDHGEEDFEERRRVEAAVEAERLILATQKALKADAGLLTPAEQQSIDLAIAGLRAALTERKAASVIQGRSDDLDRATQRWAGERMNRAITSAIAGRDVTQVASKVAGARGVESHLREHAGLTEEEGTEQSAKS